MHSSIHHHGRSTQLIYLAASLAALTCLIAAPPVWALRDPPLKTDGAKTGAAKTKKPPKKDADEEEKTATDEKPAEKIRWGKRRSEPDEQYDKRHAALIKKVEEDKHGDYAGGNFQNAKGEKIRLWTYMGNPFIVRSDISKEFTADAAMYMEMLHREYGSAYSKLLGGVKPDLREKG